MSSSEGRGNSNASPLPDYRNPILSSGQSLNSSSNDQNLKSLRMFSRSSSASI